MIGRDGKVRVMDFGLARIDRGGRRASARGNTRGPADTDGVDPDEGDSRGRIGGIGAGGSVGISLVGAVGAGGAGFRAGVVVVRGLDRGRHIDA